MRRDDDHAAPLRRPVVLRLARRSLRRVALTARRVPAMPSARHAQCSDLAALLDLFRRSEVSAVAAPLACAERIWTEMLARDGVAVFVADAGAAIAATCVLITAPNLLRGGRGHGSLENVVADPDHRGQGYRSAVVRAALGKAAP
jgi:GNAT superfamily N-acetyltransferase